MRMGGAVRSRPASVRNRLPAASVAAVKPASSAQSITRCQAAISPSLNAWRLTPPSRVAPISASAIKRVQSRSASIRETETIELSGAHDLAGQRARIARQPTAGFDLGDEFGQQRIERRRLLEIEGVAGFRKDRKPASWNRLLQEDAGLQAVIILVADYHQRRHVNLLESVFEIVERRPARLYAAHGIGRPAIGMGGEAIGEFLPTARVLVLELHAARAERIHLREFLGALLFEIIGNLQRDAAKILLEFLLAAIAGAGDRERQRALGCAQTNMHGAEAAHREPDDVRLVDLEPVEHGHGIVGG